MKEKINLVRKSRIAVIREIRVKEMILVSRMIRNKLANSILIIRMIIRKDHIQDLLGLINLVKVQKKKVRIREVQIKVSTRNEILI